jgi:hypothetical protein
LAEWVRKRIASAGTPHPRGRVSARDD